MSLYIKIRRQGGSKIELIRWTGFTLVIGLDRHGFLAFSPQRVAGYYRLETEGESLWCASIGNYGSQDRVGSLVSDWQMTKGQSELDNRYRLTQGEVLELPGYSLQLYHVRELVEFGGGNSFNPQAKSSFGSINPTYKWTDSDNSKDFRKFKSVWRSIEVEQVESKSRRIIPLFIGSGCFLRDETLCDADQILSQPVVSVITTEKNILLSAVGATILVSERNGRHTVCSELREGDRLLIEPVGWRVKLLTLEAQKFAAQSVNRPQMFEEINLKTD